MYGSVACRLLERVQWYSGRTGGQALSQEALLSLERSLVAEARSQCVARQWLAALDGFAHALAVSEQAHDTSMRAAIVHNLGYCLHNIGEFEAAKAYYEEALAFFQGVCTPPGQAQWTVGGIHADVNQSRIDFIKERLLDVCFRRPPDPEYLDEWGRRRMHVPEPEQESEHDGGCSDARPAWVATSAAGGAIVSPPDERSAAEMEAARQQWLGHYCRTGEWEKAAAYVVTAGEAKDVDYLQQREHSAAAGKLAQRGCREPGTSAGTG